MNSITPSHPFDSFSLDRVPVATELQAWNAADELVLERLRAEELEPNTLLLINDAFGALAVALGDAVADWWNDSAMSRDALLRNCDRNGVPPPSRVYQPGDLHGPYPTVVMHAPKSLALFEWQLTSVVNTLAPDGRVYVLGMVKHLSQGHQKVMGRRFDVINPGRAIKKARCVELSAPIRVQTSNAPSRYRSPQGLEFINHPGSFAERGPDPGALAFLQHLDRLPPASSVVDLGCGNGILGLSYLRCHPNAHAILVDESAQAAQSARDSARANGLSALVTVHHNNGLADLGLADIPLVLCNPPFHQETTLTTDIAEQMFADAAAVLAGNGEFWVVGNRHLDYHRSLTRWFRSVSVVSRHPKFVVVRCRNRK